MGLCKHDRELCEDCAVDAYQEMIADLQKSLAETVHLRNKYRNALQLLDRLYREATFPDDQVLKIVREALSP